MYYFIINPSSRSGKGMALWKEIQTELNRHNISYQAIHTTGSGHATKLSHHLSLDSRKKMLIVLGGDGTLHEVINGLSPSSSLALGYIPTGSSNDLARSLKLESKPLKALSNILSGVPLRQVDYGTLSLSDGSIHRFVVSCGIGFDASICAESVDSPIKKLCNFLHLGKLSYIAIGIKHIFTQKGCDGTLVLDDRETIPLKNLFFASSHIHPFEGGGLAFCPNADYKDGALDLCVVEAKWIPKRLFILICALLKKHESCKGVHIYRCQKAVFHLDKPLFLHTDGESKYEKTADFTVSSSPTDHYQIIG